VTPSPADPRAEQRIFAHRRALALGLRGFTGNGQWVDASVPRRRVHSVTVVTLSVRRNEDSEPLPRRAAQCVMPGALGRPPHRTPAKPPALTPVTAHGAREGGNPSMPTAGAVDGSLDPCLESSSPSSRDLRNRRSVGSSGSVRGRPDPPPSTDVDVTWRCQPNPWTAPLLLEVLQPTVESSPRSIRSRSTQPRRVSGLTPGSRATSMVVLPVRVAGGAGERDRVPLEVLRIQLSCPSLQVTSHTGELQPRGRSAVRGEVPVEMFACYIAQPGGPSAGGVVLPVRR
jgi:hypothetical protein